MSNKAGPCEITYLGVDPSGTASGYFGAIFRVEADGVEHLERSFHGTVPLTELESLPWAEWRTDLLVFAIECPRAMYRGSNHVVKFAAGQWGDLIRKRFPGRCRNAALNGYRFVDPCEWRRMMLRNVPGATAKEQAQWLAAQAGLKGLTDDEAEAFCLMGYARFMYRLKMKAKEVKR